jgi:hypothetical protein
MTLQASGLITLEQIDNEFKLGKDLDSYRGKQWFRDDTTTGTFQNNDIQMSEFYSKRPDDPMPVYEHLGSVLMSNSYVDAVSTTISLGSPDPTRRIIAYHVCDYQSGPSSPINLFQSATFTVNGVQYPSTRIGNLNEGFPLTTEFTFYTGRTNIFTSELIPTGSIATVNFSCTLRTRWSRIGFASIKKILNPTPVFTQGFNNSAITISNMPAGSICIVAGRSGATAYNGATIQFIDQSGAQGTYSGGFYQNLNRAPETRTISGNTGNITIWRYR